jgi:hypothetical protein
MADDKISDWNTKQLAGFVSRIINSQTPLSSEIKDTMEVASILKVEDQVEMSPQALLYLGEHIRSPSARVYNASAPSIANATWTTMAWDTKSHDTTGDQIWNPATSTNRLTIPLEGLYHVTAFVGSYYGSNVLGQQVLQLTGNWGTAPYRVVQFDGNWVNGCAVSDFLRFVKGDYVQVQIFQNANDGNAHALVASHNYFAISRVG